MGMLHLHMLRVLWNFRWFD